MKYFGTVTSYDAIKGHGELKQEAGGSDLPFEKSAFQWDKDVAPSIGQRLSYDIGQSSSRGTCALNLQTI
jgi:cold shock CspA family protein